MIKTGRKEIGKRMTAALLTGILLLLLTGCGQNQEDGAFKGFKKNGKGRYEEKQLPLPDWCQGNGSVSFREDGTMVFLDKRSSTISFSTDSGETWETETNDKISEFYSRGRKEITGIAISGNGEFFFSFLDYEDAPEDRLLPEKYLYIDEKGNQSEFELGLDNYESDTVKAVFGQTGRVYLLLSNRSIYEVNIAEKRAEKLLDLQTSFHVNLFVWGDSIAVTDSRKVYLLQTETGEFDSSDTVLNEHVEKAYQNGEKVIVGGREAGKIFVASDSGIYSHNIGGNVMEQLLGGSFTNLGNPSKNQMDLQEGEDGRLYILYEDGELDAYAYNSDISAAPEKQLTIYSLYDNETARQTISSFREAFPDVYVKMEVGLTGSNGMTVDDAVKNLNTELLAGTGPDIIFLDGMPMESYIEKGMLIDLSEIVREIEEDAEFFTNILEAYRMGKQIYAVPTRYCLPIINGEKDVINQVTDLKTLADVVEQQAESGKAMITVLGTYTAEETLECLYSVCENAWYQAEGAANKEAVREFLIQAKRIYEGEQRNLDDSERGEHEKYLSNFGSSGKGRIYDVLYHHGSDADAVLFDEYRIGIGIYGDMVGVERLNSVKHFSEEQTYKIFPGQADKVFIPSGIAGISAKSGGQKLAAEFLKLMLGQRVQKKDLGEGLPVNKDAFLLYASNQEKEKVITHYMELTTLKGEMKKLNFVWPNTLERKELEKVIGELQTPMNLDNSLCDEIITVGAKALTGEKDIEECVEEICQKITLRSKE